MAYSKAHLYAQDLFLVSLFGKVIGHPERLKIIQLLKDTDQLTTGQIAANSPLSVPSISQHLKILREQKIVNYEEVGPIILYRLNLEKFEEGFELLESFVSKWMRKGE